MLPVSVLLVLGLVVILAYWQLVHMYFWADDWDMFLKVIRPDLGYLWNLGPGPFGVGPYRYLHTPFVFLFPLFGMNASLYFLGVIILYFVASLLVYLLLMQIADDKKIALATAAVFASMGYIGSYTVTHLSNAYQMLGAIIMICITLWFLARHYKTHNYTYYFLSIISFVATIQFEFLRVHGILFLVVGLSFATFSEKKSIKTMIAFLSKLLPFIFVFQYMYTRVLAGGANHLHPFTEAVKVPERFFYLTTPLGSFLNTIIPDLFTRYTYNVFFQILGPDYTEILLLLGFAVGIIYFSFKRYRIMGIVILCFGIIFFRVYQLNIPYLMIIGMGRFEYFTILLSFFFLLFLIFFVLSNWRKKRVEARLLLFGIIWVFGQMLGYFVAAPTAGYPESVSRYNTPATVGSALVIAALFAILIPKSKRVYPVGIFLICLVFLVLINRELHRIVIHVSSPTKMFYSQIKKSLPSVTKDPVFLITYSSDSIFKYPVINSFADSAVAISYQLQDRPHVVSSFVELSELIAKKQVAPEDVFWIHFRGNIGNNNSEKLHALPNNKKNIIPISSQWHSLNGDYANADDKSFHSSFISTEKGTIGNHPTITNTLSYPLDIPSVVTFDMAVTPLNFSSLTFPYTEKTVENDRDYKTISTKERIDILRNEQEWKFFLRTSKVTVSSELSHTPDSNLKDGDLGSNWSALPSHWSETRQETIDVDLGSQKQITRFVWVNFRKKDTPKSYSILVSKDGIDWEEVKENNAGDIHDNNEIVQEDFIPIDVQFVRMVIYETWSGSMPTLTEVWVSIYNDNVFRDNREFVRTCPFCHFTGSLNDAELMNSLLATTAKATFGVQYEEDTNFLTEQLQEIPIITDGTQHTYTLYIGIWDTKLTGFKLDGFQFPVEFAISNLSIRPASLLEIKNYAKYPVRIDGTVYY